MRITFTAAAREILNFDGMTDIVVTQEQTGLVETVRFDGSLEIKVNAEKGFL